MSPRFKKPYLTLFVSFGIFLSGIAFCESHENGLPRTSSRVRPTAEASPALSRSSAEQIIKDQTGAVIGTLIGNEIKSPQGAVLAEVVRDANGDVTSTMWNIDQLGSLPEGSPLRRQYDALKEEIARLKSEANEVLKRIEERIGAADNGAKMTADEIDKLSGFVLTPVAWVTGTYKGLKKTIDAYKKEGEALQLLRKSQKQSLEEIGKLIQNGNLSEARALLLGKGEEYREKMGDITRQTIRNFKVSNEQLTKAIQSANNWETGLRTTRNIAVVGGAVVATGGLASVGFIAAAPASVGFLAVAAGGTAAGTTIGALSNYTEAAGHVRYGNMSSEEAYRRAHQATAQDALTSLQVGIAGGTASVVGKTMVQQGLVQAGTRTGALIAGTTSGAAAGLTGSVAGTAINIATGNEKRTWTQIGVDTATQTITGAASGAVGGLSQFKLDRLAARQGGTTTLAQRFLNRAAGDVVAPTAISVAGSTAARVATGRELPTAEELITDSAINVVGAMVGARVSSKQAQQQMAGNRASGASTPDSPQGTRAPSGVQVSPDGASPHASQSDVLAAEPIMVGSASGREFNPTRMGGPIRDLSTDRIQIKDRGIDAVVEHLSRFPADKANQIMVDRLRRIAAGEIEPTQYDKNFYSHELRESVRYRRLGHRTGQGESDTWDNTHAATLEDYGLHEIDPNLELAAQMGVSRGRTLYHPEAWRAIDGEAISADAVSGPRTASGGIAAGGREIPPSEFPQWLQEAFRNNRREMRQVPSDAAARGIRVERTEQGLTYVGTGPIVGGPILDLLPTQLRQRILAATDSQGNLTITRDLMAEIEAAAGNEILRLSRSPDRHNNLIGLDDTVRDGNEWVGSMMRPNVSSLGWGHGLAGEHWQSINILATRNLSILDARLPIRGLIDDYRTHAPIGDVEHLFLTTCSGGLCGPKGQAANAQLVADGLERSVVAAMGVHTLGDASPEIGVVGRSRDNAFGLFKPGDDPSSPRLLSWDEFRNMLFLPGSELDYIYGH